MSEIQNLRAGDKVVVAASTRGLVVYRRTATVKSVEKERIHLDGESSVWDRLTGYELVRRWMLEPERYIDTGRQLEVTEAKHAENGRANPAKESRARPCTHPLERSQQ